MTNCFIDETLKNQRGIKFFDRDHDGKIVLLDSYKGFRTLGINIIFSIVLSIWLNLYLAIVSFSWSNPAIFTIQIDNLWKSNKSIARVLSSKGHIDLDAFEKEWRKYDTGTRDKISFLQLMQLSYALETKGKRVISYVVNNLVWVFIWWLAADQQGMISKDRVLQSFEGTILSRIEQAKAIVMQDRISWKGLTTNPLTSKDRPWKRART